MAKEDRRNIVPGSFRSADALALGFGIGHAALYPGADDRQLQFCEYSAHLDKCLGHGINLALPAIDGDAADDLKPQALFLDDADDLAQLLGGARKTADLKCDDGVARLRAVQQHVQVLFDGGVAVLIFEHDFFRAGSLQLADLARDILFVLIGRAPSIPVTQRKTPSEFRLRFSPENPGF